jgi:hypothetical protein
MSELLTYGTYHTEEEAKDLTDLLETMQIRYEVERHKNALDKIYIGDDLSPTIAVKIKSNDFEAVNAALRLQAKNYTQAIDPGYYLLHFSNDELIAVIQNDNEWNAFDQGLAEKLLSERQVAYDRSKVNSPGEAVVKPYTIAPQYLVLEYLLSILAPYAGIIIGLATIAAFRTLRNGTKVKMYDDPSRNHGRILLVIGVIRTLYTFYFYHYGRG